MLTIYHVPMTRSVRVVWLCRELALPHDVKTISFSPEFRNSAAWRKLNPVGKVPAMTEGPEETDGTNGTDGDFTLFESGAMVQYLLDRYGDGRLQPQRATRAHGLYLQWSWFAEATFARPIGEIVNHRRVFGDAGQIPAVIEEMKGRIQQCLQAVDEALAGRSYLVEDTFSAADIMMGYSVMLARRFVPLEPYVHVSAYWQRLAARSALQETLAIKD